VSKITDLLTLTKHEPTLELIGMQEQDLVPSVGAASAGVLRFTEKRNPIPRTQFVRLRVIDHEGAS